jgi:hypothetical protein
MKNDRLISAKHVAACNHEDEGVSDLAGSASQEHANWWLLGLRQE